MKPTSRMKRTGIVLVLGLLMSSAGPAFSAEYTADRVIGNIQIQENGGTYFLAEGTVGWGASSCPDTKWVYVPSSIRSRVEFLVLAMVSREKRRAVRFSGDCDPSGYFYAEYIISK